MIRINIYGNRVILKCIDRVHENHYHSRQRCYQDASPVDSMEISHLMQCLF